MVCPRAFPSAITLLAAAVLCTACGREEPTQPTPGGITPAPLRAATTGEGPRFRRLDPAACGLQFTNELRKENCYQYLTNGAGLAVGDYDGDGLPDVYLVSQDGPNRLFRQKAPLVFEDATASAGNVDGGEAWGTGASFADVDRDGDLDLYVCNLEAKNLLYVNQGDGTFREDAAKFGLDVAAASMMAAFADYDNDGSLDMYLLTNRALHGGWAMTPEVLDAVKAPADSVRKPVQMVPTVEQLTQVGALERDGKLHGDADLPQELRDHLLVFGKKTFMTGEEDRLFRRVGDRFVDVTRSAGIAGRGMGLSATWWDYDDDGYADLYVANDLESPDTLYRNQRNGTFRDVTAEVLPHTAYYGMGSDAGDVDGDGQLDFLVADMSMTTHKKAKVLMGDMNRQRDFLIGARPPQYMRNALFLNTGTGRFQEAGILAGVASTDWTWSVLFGDLDNDARLDLFATNGIARFDTDPDLELKVRELWSQNRQQAAIELIQNVRKVPEKNLALRNTGDLKFAKTGADWGLDLESISHGAALVDLDGDGDLDVIVNNWNEPCAVYENRTTDGNAIVVRLVGQASDRFGVGARVTAILKQPGGSMQRIVREVSLSRGYLSGQSPELHFGIGTARSVDALIVNWPSGHPQAFEALQAGHRYTITEPTGAVPEDKFRKMEEQMDRVFADFESALDQQLSDTGKTLHATKRKPTRSESSPPAMPFRSRWTWREPGIFDADVPAPAFRHRENEFDEYRDQPLLPAGVARLGPGMAVGDADGDGLRGLRNELFVGGARGQAGALFTNTNDGWRSVPGPWDQDAVCEDMGVLWLDYDTDGDLDLFVASGGAEVKEGDASLRDRIYRNDGELKFVRDEGALPDVRESSGHACAADFDRDGDLDLFVAGRLVPGAYPDAPPSRLYRNDGGKFVDTTMQLAPALLTAGMVTSALFTDADDDGWLDLLVAAHWQPIRLLKNDGGKRFADTTETAGLAKHSGWWNSLCAWDYDADGDLDYVAGNQGWNTKYKANPEHPARLFFGDFDDNGTRDLVEAKYEGDNLLPVRGRSCSSQAMPFLATKFPTYDAFASSLLKDIYPEQKLASCGQLEATTLASSILRNDGKGHFTVEPLPRRAQIAPIFGMVALGDMLVCAQNSWAPEPETGRHDGGTGLVLLAGNQGIEVVPADRHGIEFFGDQKSVVFDAEEGTLRIAANDGDLRSWRWGTGEAAIELPKTKGNPQAIGARVTLEFADGRRRAVEVHAGSGYLSHTPAWLGTSAAGGTDAATNIVVRDPDGDTTNVPAAK